MAWLLDTNVLSELRKPQAERKVLEFIASAPISQLYVSVASLAEIRYGIELSADAQKRSALQDWLKFKVRPMFDTQRTLKTSFSSGASCWRMGARQAIPSLSLISSSRRQPSTMASLLSVGIKFITNAQEFQS